MNRTSSATSSDATPGPACTARHFAEHAGPTVCCFGGALDGNLVTYDSRGYGLKKDGHQYTPYWHGDVRILVCGRVPSTRRLETVLRRHGMLN